MKGQKGMKIVALSQYMSNRNVLYINYYKRVAIRVKVILGLLVYRESAKMMFHIRIDVY